eukprot:6185298-Pleurochrysis_carterae.AAC.2
MDYADRKRRALVPRDPNVASAGSEVHELYRNNMNRIDLHNKLRLQGIVSMADVWATKNWPDRHFDEKLSFTEVNIFLALKYFHPEYKAGLDPPELPQAACLHLHHAWQVRVH